MGLDMWIRRVRKPTLEDKVYTMKELNDIGYSMTSVESAEREMSELEQLLPYTVVRNVLTDYYDKEKMIADYHLPKDSSIGMYSYHGIQISGINDDGKRVSQFISRTDIEEKYTVTKSVPHYVWMESDEAYWRKHYDLQSWFYDNLEYVDNCGYYILNADLIAEMNEKFHEDIAEDDPTDEEALFYHEWY
jgi:hypothetical protein